MLGLLKKLFGGTSVNYAELVENGAQIIDVRSPQEFAGGHVRGSKNIPLNALQGQMNKIKKRQTCNYLLCIGYEKCFCKRHLKIERIY